MSKRPFDIDAVMRRVAQAVESLPKAALFELAEEGFDTPFEQLVACILSIRTRDETTLPCARRLFAAARTPATLAALAPEEIDALINDSTFHERKAVQLRDLAQTVEAEYGGVLPCDFEVLVGFEGVGPKCANLTLGIACSEPVISVDVHVHRVTNRWGYVQTRSPEKTWHALREQLPEKYRVEINRVLVPFGKHICTGRRPKCSTCPVLAWCDQVGVEDPR